MMTRVFAGELLRFFKRLASYVSLAVVAFVLLLDYASYSSVSAGRPIGLQIDAWSLVLTRSAGFIDVVACMITILMVAGEFEWRTARQNLIDGLSRNRWFAGKVTLVIFLAIFFQLFRTAVGITCIGTLVKDQSLQLADFGVVQLHQFTGLASAILLTCCIGLWIAMLVRSAGAAIGTTVLAAILDGVAGTALQYFKLESWGAYSPLQLIIGLHGYSKYIPYDPKMSFSAPKGLTALELETAALVWIAVLLVSAWALFRRRDI